MFPSSGNQGSGNGNTGNSGTGDLSGAGAGTSTRQADSGSGAGGTGVTIELVAKVSSNLPRRAFRTCNLQCVAPVLHGPCFAFARRPLYLLLTTAATTLLDPHTACPLNIG